MPRYVDPMARRMEITSAAMRILARGGPQALTLKSLADELGGSITLVTHFISNRAELFTVIVDELADSYEQELREGDEGLADSERLWRLLVWMTPSNEDEVEAERARINLISHRHEHPSIEHFFESMEQRMRALLRERLTGLIPEDEVEAASGYLRAMTNGLTLSAVEHPDLWSSDRVEQALRTAVRGLGLEIPTATAPA